MEILPNNLSDFPPGKSFRDPDDRSAGRPPLPRLIASRVALLLIVGALVGFGAYRFVFGPDDVSPPPPSLATPPQDLVEPTPIDPNNSTPSEPGAPQLVVTGLLGNQPESQNWAGYAATEGSYTGISATWTVPDIGRASPAGIDAAWVGIGGVRSHDLIQAGTQRTVLGNGATQSEVWVELLPRAAETVPLILNPGDAVHVAIEQRGPETWRIAFTNLSSGQTYEVTKDYASSLSSAEWVEEAPSAGRRRVLPLDNFGTVRFSQAAAVRETQVLNISQSGAHAITMITPGGQHLVETSRVAPDGESFSVTRTSVPSPALRGR